MEGRCETQGPKGRFQGLENSEMLLQMCSCDTPKLKCESGRLRSNSTGYEGRTRNIISTQRPARPCRQDGVDVEAVQLGALQEEAAGAPAVVRRVGPGEQPTLVPKNTPMPSASPAPNAGGEWG